LIVFIIYDRNIEQQAEHVDKVKRSERGVITNPFFLTPDHQVFDAEITVCNDTDKLLIVFIIYDRNTGNSVFPHQMLRIGALSIKTCPSNSRLNMLTKSNVLNGALLQIPSF
jgi:hypothetical protein